MMKRMNRRRAQTNADFLFVRPWPNKIRYCFAILWQEECLRAIGPHVNVDAWKLQIEWPVLDLPKGHDRYGGDGSSTP
jgi:hypothetical protein